MNIFKLLFICSIFSAAGDYFSKKFILDHKIKYLFCIFGVWSIATFLWLVLLSKVDTLARASKMWTVMYTIMMLFVSQVIFKEIITIRQWIGIILGFISLLIMI